MATLPRSPARFRHPAGGSGAEAGGNLLRFGVFAANSTYRARVTPTKRGRGGQHDGGEDADDTTLSERRVSMTWAQRLKRMFGMDIETCPACGGAIRIIANIEDSVVI